MWHDESTNYLRVMKNVFQHFHECSSTKGKEGATWCWLFHHMFTNGWCAGAEETLIRAGQSVLSLLTWTVRIWESVTQTQTRIKASTCYCFRRVWHLTCHTLPASLFLWDTCDILSACSEILPHEWHSRAGCPWGAWEWGWAVVGLWADWKGSRAGGLLMHHSE